MVISPWGEVVADLGGFDAVEGYNEVGKQPPPSLALVDLDLSFTDKVRAEMPLLRRTDVYPEV